MILVSKIIFRDFLNEFKKRGRRVDWKELYDDAKGYTREMVGDSKSREQGDYGLWGVLGKKYDYEIQAEWMRIDQIWYYYLKKPTGWKEKPWQTDVAIEHENYYANIEYTLWKIGEFLANLKICIFYPDRDKKDKDLKKIGEIISQRSNFPNERYLIIFGFKEKDVFWELMSSIQMESIWRFRILENKK